MITPPIPCIIRVRLLMCVVSQIVSVDAAQGGILVDDGQTHAVTHGVLEYVHAIIPGSHTFLSLFLGIDHILHTLSLEIYSFILICCKFPYTTLIWYFHTPIYECRTYL
jgi:hypothetical protein